MSTDTSVYLSGNYAPVTEEVTGLDLVEQQLLLAQGRTLAELGLQQADLPAPRGFALEARINMETLGADGEVRPSGGALTNFEPPSGPGVRTDSYGYVGYATNPRFDSLLAKLVCASASADFADVVSRTYHGSQNKRAYHIRQRIAGPGVQPSLPAPAEASRSET